MFTEKFLAGRRRSRFSGEEIRSLENAVSRVREFDARQVIVRMGDRLNESGLLVNGIAARFLDTADGGRQYVGLHVAGDFVDLHAFPLERLDHNVGAITPVRMAFIPHDAIRTILHAMPHLACLLWFSSMVDAAMHRQWVMVLERLPALARVAHLLCELNVRLQLVGLSDGLRFELPLRQEDLADSTGLTPVHVNRMLRELREMRLVEFRGGRVDIVNWDALQQVAEFDPGYLYAEDAPQINDMESDALAEPERAAR